VSKIQKNCSPEFKQLVDLNNNGSKSFPQPQREYGVSKSTISGWVKQLNLIKISDTEVISMKEFITLQKENHEPRIENEITKKLPPYSQKKGNWNSFVYKQQNIFIYSYTNVRSPFDK
jgi:transposase